MSVSKEIRDEASNVVKKFEWARITVDVDYYSTQLQERGFIMSANDANKIPGKSSIEPVLEVDVKASWLVPRAITNIGYDSAELRLRMGRGSSASVKEQKSRELRFLGPFTNPIGQARKLTVDGCITEEILDWTINFEKYRPRSSEAVQEIISKTLSKSNEAVKRESWKEAHDKALSGLGLIDVAFKYAFPRPFYRGILYDAINYIDPRYKSNMTLARLKLGDLQGALRKGNQINPKLLIGKGEYTTPAMRLGMVYAKLERNREAFDYFKSAYYDSRQDPQVIVELDAFKQHMEEKTSKEDRLLLESVFDLLEGSPSSSGPSPGNAK